MVGRWRWRGTHEVFSFGFAFLLLGLTSAMLMSQTFFDHSENTPTSGGDESYMDEPCEYQRGPNTCGYQLEDIIRQYTWGGGTVPGKRKRKRKKERGER